MRTRTPRDRSLGRLRRGAVGALAAALVVPLAAPAVAEPSEDPVVEYEFTQTSGDTVPETGGGEPAIVQNPRDEAWTGTSLRLSGGDPDTGTWVRLPDDLLTEASSATITTEVKIDEEMRQEYNFLWNIGAEGDTTNYFFSSVKDAPRTAITTGSNAGERSAQADANLQADRWYSLTSVLDGEADTLSFYVDGDLVGSTGTELEPSSITEQTMNTIGRSPWPDALFAGEVSAFRVHDRALDAEEVAAASTEDAAGHHDEILARTQELLESLDPLPEQIEDDYLALPTAGGEITWSSSDPSVIAEDGRVTQPEQGAEPIEVTLTATAGMRGISSTREQVVTVVPSSATAEERARAAAAQYVLPPLLADGAALPDAPEGVTATPVDATGARLDGDRIHLEGDDRAEAAVTVEIARESAPEATVTKTFDLTLLPQDEAATLAAYHRAPTSEQEANNADIAYSMHLALAGQDGWEPLNENYGIYFPETAGPHPDLGPSSELIRSLRDPAVFAMPEGGYGIVATRLARGGGPDGTQSDSVLVATSPDLRTYEEIGLLELDEAGGVNQPTAIYDSAAETYRLSWTTDAGAVRHQSFSDLVAAVEQGEQGSAATGAVTGTVTGSGEGIDDFGAGIELTVPQEDADALLQRFGRIAHTGFADLEDVSVPAGGEVDAAELPDSAVLEYSDGSTREMPLEDWDLSGVDLTTPGRYTAETTVQRDEYPTPFADERADPSAFKYEHDGETTYLMIATNDPDLDNVNQQGHAFMPLRAADTLAGLADAADPEEVHLLERGDVDAHGETMTGCFWAPELHEIDGRLSILFMPCYGDSPDYMNGRASIMQLEQDADGHDLDPMDPASWTAPRHVTRADGSALNALNGVSLDMTYFEDADGQAYYAWQQVCATWIATVDPRQPDRLTSEPVRIIDPGYAWDNVCAEGPNVLPHDGKLLMLYSGSSVGDTYTTGLATAEASGTDLTDPASWTTLNHPLQKSGLYDGQWQLGTGHGMWSEDEHGNLLYVFHARTDHDGLTGRDMFVRRVHFDAEGMPVLDMEPDEEVTEETVRLTIEVTEAEAVSVEATTRCVAGTAVLAATVTNPGDEAVEAAVTTPFGERTVEVAAGGAESSTFSSRSAEIDAGTVSVRTGDDEATATYAAASCR